MTKIFARAFVALSLAAAPVAAADLDQLAAGAGVSAQAAQGMTLNELAARKFNRDSDGQNQQAVNVDRTPVMIDATRHAQLIAAAGLTADEAEGLTLSELAAGKYNVNRDSDERVIVVMSTRGPVRIGSQLAAAAGLDGVEAQGMSLTAIAAAKFNRDSNDDNQQTIDR